MSTVGKKKISQQLVEFLLVVPFMVIILGILTEYAYALNINLTIDQGIKMATSAGYTAKDASGVDQNYGTYSQIKPPDSTANSADYIVQKVREGFTQYLKDNNVPTRPENNITVTPLTIPTTKGQITVFVASYTYIPAFTLPNVYFKFMPDEFHFSASSTVPSAFLGDNSAYTIKTDDLNHIWASGGDLADKTSFDASRQGIIKSDTGGGRNSFTFLIPNSELNGSSTPIEGDGPLSRPIELVHWDGGITHQAVDMSNGTYYTWRLDKRWIVDIRYEIPVYDKDGKIVSYAPRDYSHWYYFIVTSRSGSYSPSGQTVFVHDPQITDISDMSNWNPSGATDLSPTSVSGALKNMVTLTSSGGGSTGRFESDQDTPNTDIPVSVYNPSAAGSNQYSVKYNGVNKLIYTAADKNDMNRLGW